MQQKKLINKKKTKNKNLDLSKDQNQNLFSPRLPLLLPNIYRNGNECSTICKYNHNNNVNSLQQNSATWLSGMEPWLSNARARPVRQGRHEIVYTREV